MTKIFLTFLVIINIALLTGCASPRPSQTNNVCKIFEQYPDWYAAAKQAEQRWNTPVYVQMAIMKQESHFGGTARPPRTYLLGFIPWFRPTTAYGYAQVKDETWNHYEDSTGNTMGLRSNFADAVDFVAWYTNLAHKKLGISSNDAYNLYLAYHEGMGGYKRKTYLKKQWLIKVARKVQSLSQTYRYQLAQCKNSIPSPSFWW